MSFLYDRGQNVSGTIEPTLDYVASYGMQVNFNADLAQYNTVDNYIYMMPKGLNHLQMTATIPYTARKQEDARKILGFFESLNGTGSFLYTDPALIYKPINVFVDKIENTFDVNDLHNVQVSVSSDQSSSLLNWNNNFLTGATLRGDWVSGAGGQFTSYSKYDVVRYTGNAALPSNANNLYDSFYYCTGSFTCSHPSSAIAAVNTMPNSEKWTREFSFDPTDSAQLSTEPSVIKTELPYSFTKRTKFGLHSGSIKSFKLDFNGISNEEARCILHFLIARQGYRKFQYKIPKIYKQNKYFFASQWSHTLVYKNVNNISVSLTEDPLGVRRVY